MLLMLQLSLCHNSRNSFHCFTTDVLSRLHLSLQRSFERPCLNDVTEIGVARRAVLGVSVFLAVAALLPLWDDLAENLGIGLGTTML